MASSLARERRQWRNEVKCASGGKRRGGNGRGQSYNRQGWIVGVDITERQRGRKIEMPPEGAGSHQAKIGTKNGWRTSKEVESRRAAADEAPQDLTEDSVGGSGQCKQTSKEKGKFGTKAARTIQERKKN